MREGRGDGREGMGEGCVNQVIPWDSMGEGWMRWEGVAGGEGGQELLVGWVEQQLRYGVCS
jgi:hypothetical protein